MAKVLTFAEKIAASWKDPQIRATRLKNRSKNKSWQASRHRCAVNANKSLHANHKESFKHGREKLARRMKKLHATSVYKKKHCRAMRKVAARPEYRAKLSRLARKRVREGRQYPFWKSANVSHGPSKRELKVVKFLKRAGLKFIHQFNVPGTFYVADICFPEKKVIVEVDGHPYHYTDKGIAHKNKRDRILRAHGFSVIHINQKALDRSMSRIVKRVKKFVGKK